jgi:hypothetical protein
VHDSEGKRHETSEHNRLYHIERVEGEAFSCSERETDADELGFVDLGPFVLQ